MTGSSIITSMASTTKELRIASASDIHLGHPKTPSSLIAQNLKDAFPHNAETAMLDVIIFAGDVTDRLLNLPQDEVEVIDDVFLYMLRLCARYNILFLILEGTPSHDRHQSKRFQILNETHKVGCNMHYVEDLEIRYFHEIDSHILFVPDEWGTAEKTIEAVREQMLIHGLSKVDYAIMHGQFEYQLPDFVPAQKHNSAEYMAIVDKVIFIGHIHQFSQNGKIIAHGSFDRLAHNEEMPKGHVRVNVRSGEDWDCTFVENKGAKKYVTIDCKGITTEESLAKIDAVVAELPDDSYVRISAETDNPILQSIGQYERKYVNLSWDAHERVSKELKADKKKNVLEEKIFMPVQITDVNISRLVREKMQTLSTDEELIEAASAKLLELI